MGEEIKHKTLSVVEYNISQHFKKILPLIIVSNAVNNCLLLEGYNVVPRFKNMILPSTVSFFVPMLLSNLVFVFARISPTLLISFLVGNIIYLSIGSIPVVKEFFSLFGIVGKVSFLLAMKKNIQPFYMVLSWTIISDIVGITLKKVLSGQNEFSITNEQLDNLILDIMILGIAKKVQLTEIEFVFVFLLLYFCMRIKNRKFKSFKKIKKNKKTEQNDFTENFGLSESFVKNSDISSDSIYRRKHPVRRAASKASESLTEIETKKKK